VTPTPPDDEGDPKLVWIMFGCLVLVVCAVGILMH
jgi:hypothetical protein